MFINGDSVGGCDDLTRLHRSGKLNEMVKANKAKELGVGDQN